jgi:hypothetical protein
MRTPSNWRSASPRAIHFVKGSRNCARESPDRVPTDNIPGKLRDCLDAPIKENIEGQNYDYRNYFSRASAVLRQVIKNLPGSELNSCKSEILGAFNVINRCTQERGNLRPIFPDAEQRGLAYAPGKPAHEMLTEISNYGSGFSDGDPPTCLFPLQDRILYLQSCLRTASEPTPPETESEAPVSSADDGIWSDIWRSGAESQELICGDGTALGNIYGRKMQAMNRRLGDLRPQDRDELKRLLTLRTDYELRQPQFTDPATPDGMNMADARCHWASLALAWTWLGDHKQSTRLFDALLTKEPASGSQMLDFYLGIADALKNRAPAQAKRFLDRSFALVDENDPALFFKTSDGSINDGFAYGKSDIIRLYADISEYRLAMVTNNTVDQFNKGAVSAYLSVLESEIRSTTKYDAKILSAAFRSPRPPGFRPQ